LQFFKPVTVRFGAPKEVKQPPLDRMISGGIGGSTSISKDRGASGGCQCPRRQRSVIRFPGVK